MRESSSARRPTAGPFGGEHLLGRPPVVAPLARGQHPLEGEEARDAEVEVNTDEHLLACVGKLTPPGRLRRQRSMSLRRRWLISPAENPVSRRLRPTPMVTFPGRRPGPHGLPSRIVIGEAVRAIVPGTWIRGPTLLSSLISSSGAS
jgi:hypothetical protein